jgi:hypothetical protein
VKERANGKNWLTEPYSRCKADHHLNPIVSTIVLFLIVFASRGVMDSDITGFHIY